MWAAKLPVLAALSYRRVLKAGYAETCMHAFAGFDGGGDVASYFKLLSPSVPWYAGLYPGIVS